MVRWIWPLLAGSLLLGAAACGPSKPRDAGGLVAPPAGESGSEEVIVLPEEPLPEDGGDQLEVEIEQEGDSLTVKELEVRAPDGSRWKSDAANEEQHRLDLEACYSYARARVRHDEQIYTDQNAAFDNITTDSRYSFLQRQQDGYGFQKQQDRSFSSCMESKGYNQL